MKKIAIVLTVMVIAGSVAAANTPVTDEDPTGRIVAARGTMQRISGDLVWEHDEWFLSGYELHLGPYGHKDEPVFTEGASATASGFVYGNHMAPVTVITGGETHRFWNSDRLPLWAGSGEGGGRVAWNDATVPQGQRLSVQDAPRPPADPPLERGPGQGAATGQVERGFRNEPVGVGRFRN